MKPSRLAKLVAVSIVLLSSAFTYGTGAPVHAGQAGLPATLANPAGATNEGIVYPFEQVREARPAEEMSMLGQYGGTAGAMGLAGDLLLAGVGSSVVILDVSDPSLPLLIGQSQDLSGYITDVDVFGDYAYISAQEGGLVILFIADPARPVWVSRFPTNSYIFSAAIRYPYLVLTEGNFGLRILNISNPAQPVQVAQLWLPNSPLEVQWIGDYAFVAAGFGGLRIIDLSDPTTPEEIGSFPAGDYTLGVEIAGDYAYLADGYAGLAILNITDLTAPVLVKRILFGGPQMDLAVVGKTVFINALFLENGIYSVDVSDPANAAVIGQYLAEDYPRFLIAGNGYLLVADYGAGLKILDYANPASLNLVGVYTDGIFNARDVKLSGRYALTTGEAGGFYVIDICNPEEPDPTGMLEGYFTWLDAAGNIAYLIGDNFQIVDMTDAGQPALLSSINFYSAPKAVKVVADTAFIAAGNLYLYDVSDPAHPQYLSEYQPMSQVEGIDVVGDYAYLAMRQTANPGGLEIVNLQGKLTQAGSLHITIATDVKVSGNYAFMAASDNRYGSGLYIVDISNPASPALVSVFPTQDEALKVGLYQHYAFIASTFGGLYAIDVSDPAHPEEIGYYPAGLAVGLDVEDGFIYLANGAYGFEILDVTANGFEKQYHVCGIVTDMQGQPIVDASISSGSAAALTDADGKYYLGSLPPGAHTMVPVKAGYRFLPSIRKITVPPNQDAQNFLAYTATLQSNYPDGSPGSFFWFTGQGYGPSQPVTIFANGWALGIVTSDDAGNLSFRVSSDLAAEGRYYIYTDQAPFLRIALSLSNLAELRLLEGNGPILALPQGIAFTDFLHLPVIHR